MEKHLFKLEGLQFPTGLFPAAIASRYDMMNECGWIKDTKDDYLAVDDKSKAKVIWAFQTITDKLDLIGKFDFSNTDWSNERYHIHPVYTKDLNEVNKEWGFLQLDSVGGMVWILSDGKDEQRALKYVDYLSKVRFHSPPGYHRCPERGYWEEDHLEIRSSSLGEVIRGFRHFQATFGKSSLIRKMIEDGREAMYKILPNETRTRQYDLALLNLCFPDSVIDDDMAEKVIANVMPLKRDFGIIRYMGDEWDGHARNRGPGREMPWLEGLLKLATVTGEREHFDRVTKIRENQKLSFLPEGFVDGKPNGTYLLRCEAYYRLAERMFN